MMKYRIDVNIVDDHAMLAEGLTEALNRSATIHVSRSFTTLAECRVALKERRPDILLLDISMPDGDGIAFCQQVTADFPKVRIVAVTIHDEYSVIRRMLDAGVHGYVLKSAAIDELVTAIERVWRRETYVSPAVEEIIRQAASKAAVLTNPEQHILRYVCEGLSNPEIAKRMNLSSETVKWYRKRLLAKFGVKNTARLVALAMKECLHLFGLQKNAQ